MKKSLMKKIALSVLASAALLSSNTAWAAPAGWKPAFSWDSTGVALTWVPDSSNSNGSVPYGTYEDAFLGIYSESENVTGGKVIITDGTFKEHGRGYGIIGGHAAEEGFSAISNTVEISGGEFNAHYISGGYAYKKHATSNTVSITGGSFNCPIYGGLTEYSTYGYRNNPTLANNNTVNIGCTANLQNADIYGGYTFDSTNNNTSEPKAVYGGQSAPNTLNIGWKDGNNSITWNPSTGRNIKSIQGFDVININGVTWDETKPFISVSGLLELDKTKVVAHISGNKSDVQNGKMSLISAGSISGDINTNSEAKLYSGVAKVYEGKITKELNNIIVELAKLPVMNNQVLVIGESRVAATAFTNQGSDLVESGIDALVRDNTRWCRQ